MLRCSSAASETVSGQLQAARMTPGMRPEMQQQRNLPRVPTAYGLGALGMGFVCDLPRSKAGRKVTIR